MQRAAIGLLAAATAVMPLAAFQVSCLRLRDFLAAGVLKAVQTSAGAAP